MRTRSLAALLVAAVALAACGGGSTDAAVGTPDAGGAAPVAGGERLLDVEAATVSGGSIDLGALAGTDLVIWFWAPW